MTAKDLNDYRAKLIENPLNISLGDSHLYVPSAPLSGPVLALILNILKGELSHHDPVGGGAEHTGLCVLRGRWSGAKGGRGVVGE